MPANPNEKNKPYEENETYKKRVQEPQTEEQNEDDDEDSTSE